MRFTRRASLLVLALAFAPAARAQQSIVPVQTKPLDVANLDTSYPACSNFFRYANGGWVANNPVPAAFARWGAFDELQLRNRTDLRAILDRAAAQRRTSSNLEMRKLGTFYAACMDSTAADRHGAQPLKPSIAQISALKTRRDIQRQVARFHSAGGRALFFFSATQDSKKSTEVIAGAGQAGLTLPDREYYLRTDSASGALRAQYVAHVANMLALSGQSRATAEADARAVLAVETDLARVSRSRVDLRDPVKNYNRMTRAQLAALTPRWDWAQYFRDRGSPGITVVDIGQPDFFRGVDSLIAARPLSDWKAYLRWRAVKGAAPALSAAFVAEDFAFNRRLSGARELLPRWQRCAQASDQELGELVSRAYVDAKFPPQAKTRALEMVNNLRAAFRERLATRDWMSDETRQRAYAKLAAFAPKIGYPDKWVDYSSLSLAQPTYYDMIRVARAFDQRRDLRKIGRPLDRSEWGMTTPTVNAYYNPQLNEIVFPAGILQPPFFDPNADDAVNYGGMGGVIGHEMSHGFDDQGAQFDAEGNLLDWWTAADKAQFQERTGLVVSQFDAYTVLDSVHVQGRLTVGENIGDLGGLNIAYAGLQKALAGKPRTLIDGFTPEQRFFLAWAQVWRQNITPENQRQRIITDPHAPAVWRVNGPLSNMPEFAEAFGCKAGDPMVRGTDVRAVIW